MSNSQLHSFADACERAAATNPRPSECFALAWRARQRASFRELNHRLAQRGFQVMNGSHGL